MKVLAIDIEGTHVKILASGQKGRREFDSEPTLSPRAMVASVKKLAQAWKYGTISMGYPKSLLRNCPVAEPHNLASRWAGFNFEAAFGGPVKVINDAVRRSAGSKSTLKSAAEISRSSTIATPFKIESPAT